MRRMRAFRILAVAAAISLAIPAIALPVVAAEKAKPYVVVMAADPIAVYGGGTGGIAATKPAAGKKVDRGSAAARQYQALLRTQHDSSLQQGGVAVGKKIQDYSYALNGYAALLTPSQVDRIKAQKGVVRVLEDQMRHPQTDSTPGFLQLTADGGPYDRGYTGENVVVGVIDTGIWPEHPSFADDGSVRRLPDRPRTVRFREHGAQRERQAVHLQREAARRAPDAQDVPRGDRRGAGGVRLGTRRLRPRHAHRLYGGGRPQGPREHLRPAGRADLGHRTARQDRRVQGAR